MGRSSREKGAKGEREAAHFISAFGFNARRDSDAADLYHDIPGVHVEVKRVEALKTGTWIAQAEVAAGDLVPVVLFRQNRQPWRVIAPAHEYLRLKALERQLLNAVAAGDLIPPQVQQWLDHHQHATETE